MQRLVSQSPTGLFALLAGIWLAVGSEVSIAVVVLQPGKDANLAVMAEGSVTPGIRVPDRIPTALSWEGIYWACLSSANWFLSSGGYIYDEENLSQFAQKEFSAGWQRLNEYSLHRLSFGQSFRKSLWHEISDLPSPDRAKYGINKALVTYEYLRVSGIQWSLGVTQDPQWNAIIRHSQDSLGLYNRLAWQWPGQENSRIGVSSEYDENLKYESLSFVFENQGFNQQILTAEYVRRQFAQSMLLLSIKSTPDRPGATKIILAIRKNRTWQLDLARQQTFWKYVLSQIKLELKREDEAGFQAALLIGLGAKL